MWREQRKKGRRLEGGEKKVVGAGGGRMWKKKLGGGEKRENVYQVEKVCRSWDVVEIETKDVYINTYLIEYLYKLLKLVKNIFKHLK